MSLLMKESEERSSNIDEQKARIRQRYKGIDPEELEVIPALPPEDIFKTAVSEAVTNAIIHAYPESGGDIEAYFKRENKKITVIITDYGVGIKDVKKSMQPLYTTLHTQERSGMGFTFMEAFSDEITVKSEPGKGTTVKLIKTMGKGEECGEDL